MTEEICSPCAPSPAMNFSATSSAATLGRNVTSAATGERSRTSSASTMNTTANSPIRPVALFPLALLAALLATGPARCSCSPAGGSAAASAACR